MVSAVLTGAGHAFPPGVPQDELWSDFFAGHFGGDRVARRIFESAGVRQRHTVVDPRVEDLSGWSTGARMARSILRRRTRCRRTPID